MRDVAGGDEQAFAELYDRYAQGIYGLVQMVVRDPSESATIFQAVFVEAWRTACSYDPGESAVTSWLLAMAHRRAVGCIRGEQSARDHGRSASDGQVTPRAAGSAELAEATLPPENLRGAPNGLTYLQREAIEHAYFRACTYREAAARLGVPPENVVAALRDGLARLGRA